MRRSRKATTQATRFPLQASKSRTARERYVSLFMQDEAYSGFGRYRGWIRDTSARGVA